MANEDQAAATDRARTRRRESGLAGCRSAGFAQSDRHQECRDRHSDRPRLKHGDGRRQGGAADEVTPGQRQGSLQLAWRPQLIDAPRVIFAKSRAELVAATRALDRVLLHHNYVVPQWTYGKRLSSAWPSRHAPACEWQPGFPQWRAAPEDQHHQGEPGARQQTHCRSASRAPGRSDQARALRF